MSNITDRRTVADKLREAKALIERGWTRGDYERDGRVCALGAIRKATRLPDDESVSSISFQRCCDAVAEVIGTDPGWESEIACWNDKQPSKKPVLAAFDKAITLADSSQ